ncbi:MAG: hypothetical protein R3C45_01575 [Phycisphaerales bacterium]
MNRMLSRTTTLLVCLLTFISIQPTYAETWPDFDESPQFDEQTRKMEFAGVESGVRLIIVAPGSGRIDPALPARVIFFATPNGNTYEQTLGCKMVDGLDWHYDIQHIAAQHRLYQHANTRENLVLVCLQAEAKSWPRWRSQHEDNAARIRDIVKQVLDVIPLKDPTVTLASHSGGGSFMFGFINGSDGIPEWVDRFIYLDSNYGYDDADKHGDKFIAWLKGDADRRLVVIAYDDREITYQGKKVVSDTGGTYRATHRMIDRFKQDGDVVEGKLRDFNTFDALGGQARLLIHPNPENIILHTRLVGEMNGHLYGMALDTPEDELCASLGGPRAYMQWVQDKPYDAPATDEAKSGADTQSNSGGLTIPPRPADAMAGRAFMKSVADLAPADRETAIRDELLRGNVPNFLRRFVAIHTRSKIADDSEVSATFEVSPDYLAVGSDEDFVRVPVTPMTAQAVADAFGCTLPTSKMVDDIYDQAPVKLAPLPLTEDRETVTTFLQHNGLIEWQRQGYKLGELVAGIKKDIVITNRLNEKPNRVAIYGWHKLDGKPIQPVYTGHIDIYVDYSHGIRLVKKTMRVGEQTTTVEAVLADPSLSGLLSDEGMIVNDKY